MMPVYVYECDVCGKRFEQHRQYGSPHPTACPDGHDGVSRVFSPPTIIFKGSGFYTTDNARSNGRAAKAAPEDKESAKPDKTPSEAKATKEEGA
jgi:putative FmdB family regulatory protein